MFILTGSTYPLIVMSSQYVSKQKRKPEFRRYLSTDTSVMKNELSVSGTVTLRFETEDYDIETLKAISTLTY